VQFSGLSAEETAPEVEEEPKRRGRKRKKS